MNIPIGKHKGKDWETISAEDPDWCIWAKTQPWFRERFGKELGYTEEQLSQTPRHNDMQLKFLDLQYTKTILNKISEEYKASPAVISGEITGVSFEPIDVAVKFGGSDPVYFDIELKPTIADDFPAILRQIKYKRKYNSRHVVGEGLVYEKYIGVAPLDKVKQMFANEGIYMVSA